MTANKNERERIFRRLDQAKRGAEELGDHRIQSEVHENDIVIRQMMSLAPDSEADPASALIQIEEIIKHYPVADAGQFSFLLNSGYIHMAMNELEKAKTILLHAREIARSENLLFGIVESSFHLVRIIHAMGSPRKALEFCSDSLLELNGILESTSWELPGIGGLEIAAGCALSEMNQNDDAEKRLVYGLNLVGWGMNPYYFYTGNFSLFQLYKRQGRKSEAAICLNKIESVWPETSFLTRGLRFLLNFEDIKNDKAVRTLAINWCEEFAPLIQSFKSMPGMGPFGGCEMYYQAALIWIEIQSEIGDGITAQKMLKAYLDQAESSGYRDRIIELFMLRMSMADDRAVKPQDWDRLYELLIDGNEGGFFQKFLLSEKSAELLSHAAAYGIQNNFISNLLQNAAQAKLRDPLGERITQPDKPDLILSAREKEILQLLERGMSNQEIAASLVITIGTVKSHVNHILRKLDASNRTQAVAIAREQGILDS
jgi:DNA-binding CsgD family transcriptional regulator